MARELDDAILSMRTNELDIGIWLLKTEGDAAAVLAMDDTLLAHSGHWLVRETIGLLRRTFSRLDVSSRSLFALIEPGSCFAGTLLELALACDRSYMLVLPDDEAARRRSASANATSAATRWSTARAACSAASTTTAGPGCRARQGRPAARWRRRAGAGPGHQRAGRHRLGRRNPHRDRGARGHVARRAHRHGSQPALQRPENMFTRIFGRLTAWQNWIFQRPNAVGEKGALKVYGKGEKSQFDWNRV
jgi:benzoyl-CoA-dihydrodiol lyase